MAGELAYVSGLTGKRFDVSDYETVDFEGALELRGREWDYTVRNGGLTGVSRKRREVSVDVHYGDAAAFDSFMRAVDADLAVGKPGRLEAVNGAGEVWTQSCYVVKSEASSHPGSSDPVCALSFVLLDGVWRHDAGTVSYQPVSGSALSGLDLPTDMGYDLAVSRPSCRVSNRMRVPMPFRLVIYGAVSNPSLTIGGNVYRLNGDVPAGAYVAVDSLKKSIMLHGADGSLRNVFSWGVRGSGLNRGQYVFQPIPAGSSVVELGSGFGFNLTIVEENGDPTWLI